EPLLAALDVDGLSDAQVDELSNHLLDGEPPGPPAAVPGGLPGDGDRRTAVADRRTAVADRRPELAPLDSKMPRAGHVPIGALGRAPDAAPRLDARPADVKRLLGRELATVLRLDRDALSEHATFQSHGLDSISGTQLAVAIERGLGIDVSPAWLLEYPTIQSLGEKLAHELGRRTA
ncbi:MAG TPA: acyl carrier protein, partial [Polyangiaceae bacterium]|nr:acyl carrier protein [Polyangiaceae bacterium]